MGDLHRRLDFPLLSTLNSWVSCKVYETFALFGAVFYTRIGLHCLLVLCLVSGEQQCECGCGEKRKVFLLKAGPALLFHVRS